MDDNKRVAVCFYGQTRTFSIINNVYRILNKLSDKLQFDFFVSTWDDFEDKSCFDFFTDKEFINPEICKFDKKVGTNVHHNPERASYLITRVNMLKLNYELNNNFIFDYVLMTISNYDITKDLDLFLRNLEEVSDNPTKYQFDVYGGVGVDESKKHSVVSPDYIFTGTSLAFDLYSNGWKRYYKLSDIWKEHHSGLHNYHGYLLKNSNLDVYVRNGLANSLLLFDKDKGREV
ncbi:hypothetical protein HOE22_00295 [Candidatus Woesearchaeota archaeon]|jgi:hypothetical protein|nr:hypothetical protein [Candidatus Neomarinimicrobiota bacterium]MBT4206767.1 hypothetical protein [Candidatus Woesearchaeota archaeon]